MYLQISKEYLSGKPNVATALKLAEKNPKLVQQYERELESAIKHYNYRRNNLHSNYSVSWNFLVNTKELNVKFPYDLVSLRDVLTLLANDNSLASKVFTNLRDNTYFKEVWLIDDPEYLLGNMLILIYRTAILYLHPKLLLDSKEQQKVQISSALEEMLVCLWLDGKKTRLFEAVRIWLKDWQTEGFSKELFDLVEPHLA